MFRFERMPEEMVEIWARKSPSERLAVAFSLWRSAREMILLQLRHRHADWSEEKVCQEAARRMSHGAVGVAPPPR